MFPFFLKVFTKFKYARLIVTLNVRPIKLYYICTLKIRINQSCYG